MVDPTRFFYYIAQKDHPIGSQSPFWTSPIPLRRNLAGLPPNSEQMPFISYGDYFTGARSFLSRNHFEAVINAAADVYHLEINPRDIEAIYIFLAKHGEFYHPSRIEVNVRNRRLIFVLNVAISDTGLQFIQKEYQFLNHLNMSFPYSFLPRVYGQGEVGFHHGRPIRLFLAEWFEGFYEFHLFRRSTDNKTGIAVWDDIRGNYYLNDAQALKLYEQAAMILTCYYNVMTSEQISSWHHAAGDFVIRVDNENLEARLITVRNHTPLVENIDNDLDSLFDALLIFFLNLSIRMRLDRIDGVGETAWCDDLAVKGTVAGFFQGLKYQVKAGLIPNDLVHGFRAYLWLFKVDDLLNWATALVDRLHPNAPELKLIKSRLNEHVKNLHTILNRNNER